MGSEPAKGAGKLSRTPKCFRLIVRNEVLLPMNLAFSPFSNPQDATAKSADWRTAALDLINFKVANGQAFSSGEIAAFLRTFRPDLRFSVTNLGEFIRDAFFKGELPCYNDGQGNPVSPSQVPRTTVGKGRTPYGVQVFVYAFNQADGDAHDFEVDIPNPKVQAGAASLPSSTPVKSPKPSAAPRTPKAANGKLEAKVWADGRLLIPRVAVDAFVHATGRTLKQGDKLFVKVEATRVVVTIDQTPGAHTYNLWADQGRITTKGAKNAVPGNTYPITVDSEALIVDLG